MKVCLSLSSSRRGGGGETVPCCFSLVFPQVLEISVAKRILEPKGFDKSVKMACQVKPIVISKCIYSSDIFQTSKTPFGAKKRASERLSPARAKLRGSASN